MNLPALDILALLRSNGIHARKSLGQNFLNDAEALKKIIESAGISRQDVVLEIGAGPGCLTRYLALSSRQVIAVEMDPKLFPILTRVMSPFSNVSLICADIMKLDLNACIPADSYLVVANIPYYLTSAIIRRLLETQASPRRIVLTIQKEVAERICSEPGELNLLALSVQVYGQPVITAIIPADRFHPKPEVDSAILRIDRTEKPYFEPTELDHFFTIARAAFSQKRKTLRNSLSSGLHIAPARIEEILIRSGLDPQTRPQDVSLPEWKTLLGVVAAQNDIILKSTIGDEHK